MTRLVWHVFGTMDIGGAEMRTLDLDREMRKRGYRFEYVALSGRRGVLDEQIVADGGAVHHLGLGVTFPWRFYRALRRSRPAVLDSHVATFSGALLLLAWLARVPVRIAHFRSDGDGHLTTPRRRAQRAVMVWLIGRFATHIVGVSPGSLTHGYRRDWEADERATVVPNGLPRPEAELAGDVIPADAGEVIALHVGRPSPEKNRVRLPGIVACARDRGWNGRLVLVGGNGPDSGPLEAAIQRSGAADHVVALGARRDVLHLMASADVLLLPSLREGLPGVVLESLSVGTPVVSADLPGSRFIGALVDGVHVVPDDSDESWADLLLALGANDPTERRRIRTSFENGPFSLERVASAHERIYG